MVVTSLGGLQGCCYSPYDAEDSTPQPGLIQEGVTSVLTQVRPPQGKGRESTVHPLMARRLRLRGLV